MDTHILVVDDDAAIRDSTRSSLAKRGFRVTTKSDGLEALEAIRQERPDLILADVLMPQMDGYAFYKELKKNPLMADIPVLIITGRGQMEDAFKVIGVDGFIKKPFSPDELEKEVRHILALVQNKDRIAHSGNPLTPKKILAAGANADILAQMKAEAEKGGYVFEGTTSGAEAITRVVKFLPDIVFVEVEQRDITSAELVDILRHLPQLENKPLVGYAYYATGDLGDPVKRQRVLRIERESQQMIKCGLDHYMGRYGHQIFILTVMEQIVHE